MLFELLGPSGAGKTYFLNKFIKSFDFILFPSALKGADINSLLEKSTNSKTLTSTINPELEKFTSFCIDSINKSSMEYIRKIQAYRIFTKSCFSYEKSKRLDECGYIIADDELLLCRAFSFLTYSSDFENDVKKFFELVPIPDVVVLCTCTKEQIKERLFSKPNMSNCYRWVDEQTMDILIEKSLYICQVAQKILEERGANLITLDLAQNFDVNQKKLEEVINNKINEYKNKLYSQLLEASGSFHKNDTRHILKTKNVFYCSYSTPNFTIPKEKSQRNSQMRLKRFGINNKNAKGKTVLDLGSNCGAMLFQMSNYGIKRGLGIEYDADKVDLANKVARLSKLDCLEFKQGNIDELDENNMEKFDIVFALAIDSHVNNKEHLFSLLSKVTKETLYFEGNSNCDMNFVQEKLKKIGFSKMEYIGFCNDDIRPQNNKRPMLVARKIKKTHKTINILGIKINIKTRN